MKILFIEKEKCDRAEKVKELLCFDRLSFQEPEIIGKLVEKYQDVFHIPGKQLTVTPILKVTIPTMDNTPVTSKQYCLPPVHTEEIETQVEELLDKGITESFNSAYSSPCF